MSFEIQITSGRKYDFAGVLTDANGNAISISAGSVIYCKVYRGAGATPDLDINGTALAGGSVTGFTVATGNYTVSFGPADTANLTPGTYDCEIALVDSGDNNKIKHAQFGIVQIIGQALGGTT